MQRINPILAVLSRHACAEIVIGSASVSSPGGVTWIDAEQTQALKLGHYRRARHLILALPGPPRRRPGTISGRVSDLAHTADVIIRGDYLANVFHAHVDLTQGFFDFA